VVDAFFCSKTNLSFSLSRQTINMMRAGQG
jgi:hypothetical protein